MKERGYWHLQLLFFLIIIGLWFLGVFCVYLLSVSRQAEENHRQIEKRESLIQQFREGIRTEEGALPSYHRKLEILEAMHADFFKKLGSILESGNLREELPNLVLPVKHASGLFIIRRGRLLYHDGLDMEYFLGKDWLKRMLPGLNSQNEELFQQAIARMYTYPISKEEFLSQRGRFLVLNYRSQQFLRFYAEKNEYSYFLLIDLLKVNAMDLNTGLESFVPPVSESIPELMDYLASIWPVHLLSMFILVWLWKRGGYLIISTRFAFRLMFVAVLFWLFFLLLIHWLVEESLSLIQDLETNRIETAMKNHLTVLEQDFLRFTSKLSKEVSQDFIEGRPFVSRYWSLGLNGLVVHQNPYQFLRSDQMGGKPLGIWSSAVLNNSILGLMGLHFYKGLENIDSVDQIHQIRNRGEEGIAGSRIQSYLQEKVLGFVSRPSEEFYYFDVMQNGMFGSWVQNGTYPQMQLMVFMISEYELVRIWLDTL
ncbi:MAG: hypothetical protein H3C47_14185, partial [Candidatus Cloacimonetes bacterium]|nr:hypothetical protein [Candidatus Cloacimonadota bacterium]